MSLEQVVLLKNILLVVLPILLLLIFMKIKWKENMEKTMDVGADFAGRILKKSKMSFLNFDSIQRFLKSKGAVYLFGDV